ncbi:hypothetical protein F5X99DRAFT_394378 [Biscogniauxia marginata]|nr:hypothetical protein F5X99DRAFT_394378 [Biscogniauxia marginata]
MRVVFLRTLHKQIVFLSVAPHYVGSNLLLGKKKKKKKKDRKRKNHYFLPLFLSLFIQLGISFFFSFFFLFTLSFQSYPFIIRVLAEAVVVIVVESGRGKAWDTYRGETKPPKQNSSSCSIECALYSSYSLYKKGDKLCIWAPRTTRI